MQGAAAVNNNTLVKQMRAVRRDVLRLLQIYINKETDPSFALFYQHFMPSLKVLVDDYKSTVQDARDPEVLSLFATMVKQMGEHLASDLPVIMEGLCSSTLAVVQSDFESYPEFREGFFRLIMHIVKHCTQGLFQLDNSSFQTVILVLIFAMQHPKPELMDIGLQALHALTAILKETPAYATQFY